MEGDSLIWEETKLKLKLASEESESLVGLSIGTMAVQFTQTFLFNNRNKSHFKTKKKLNAFWKGSSLRSVKLKQWYRLTLVSSERLFLTVLQDATVAQYEKNMSAQHSLKHSLDQKLKILTSQLEAKDVLLRDQIQKTSVLQEQMQGQKKEAVDRESVQAQIIKLKQESSRKEALVKYWKDKFQIIEEVCAMDDPKSFCLKLSYRPMDPY